MKLEIYCKTINYYNFLPYIHSDFKLKTEIKKVVMVML